MKINYGLYLACTLATVAIGISDQSHASIIVPSTVTAIRGEKDGNISALAKLGDGASMAFYSNSEAKLTANFKFKITSPENKLQLIGSMKQVTAKDSFIFQVLNTSGKFVQIGSTTGGTSYRPLLYSLPAGSVIAGTVTLRLTSLSADDVNLDYLVLDDTGSTLQPAPITPPKPVPAPTPTPTPTPPPVNSALSSGTSWYWQLQGVLKMDNPAKVYDIDLYDTTMDTIASLKAQGKTVICYFSAGTYEPNRADSPLFPAAAIGSAVVGWPGEKWLDVRNTSIRKIMIDRLSLAKSKGCDGVEPDNVDGYSNKPGFPLTANDQINFNSFLANEAHAKGLLIGLKNSTDLVPALVNKFDFAVVEECFKYKECESYSPFVNQNKAVFVAEYTSFSNATCDKSRSLNFSTVFFNLDLNGKLVKPCP